MSSSLKLHGLYHASLLCPPLSPGVCSNSCSLSPWCYLSISSSPTLFFSFCLQSFPASGSFQRYKEGSFTGEFHLLLLGRKEKVKVPFLNLSFSKWLKLKNKTTRPKWPILFLTYSAPFKVSVIKVVWITRSHYWFLILALLCQRTSEEEIPYECASDFSLHLYT